jgi:hypothetical protein
MAAVCDTLSYLADYQVTDIQRFVECLKTERRIIDVAQQENVIAGGFLDRAMPQAHAHMALFELPRVLGTFVLSPGWFRLLSYDESNLERLREAFQTLAGPALGPPRFDSRPAPLRSVMDRVLTIRFPSGTTEEQAQRFLEGHLQQMFEDQWIQRPLKSLNGITPVDAAGHANLKKKVLGLIQFQEEVATTIMPLPYDFDRLRHKLGLPTSGPKAISPAPTSSDISSMNAAELATLAVDTLSGDELQSAFQAAIRLDATELAARFAQAIVTRPYQGDRFTYFKHLNQVALDNTQMTDALEALDAGLKDDCEHNEGRRRNDYELLRAKTHLRANDAEQANAVFAGLLQRQPDSLDIIGTAAEAMLKVGAKPFAVTFAEQGVAKAKQKGDRDRIGYFQELLDAARR